VLKSNIAACYLKLEDWKEAVATATAALDGLDKLQGKIAEGQKEAEEEEEADEEIISQGAEKAEDTSAQGRREGDIERIRTKALLRRARARSEMGGWSTLQGAEEGMWGSILRGISRLMYLQTTRRSHRCGISPRRIEQWSSGSCSVCRRGSRRPRRRRWGR
jgi:hypothetical protein